MNSIAETINNCKYLYLYEMGEPSDNELRLVILEATPGEPIDLAAVGLSDADFLSNSQSIEHLPGCHIFEIIWPSYIAYSVENESYSLPESENAVGIGRLFIEYTQSRYLDYLATSTLASSDYPGPFKHWAINCLNHSIDVASTEEPIVTVTVQP